MVMLLYCLSTPSFEYQGYSHWFVTSFKNRQIICISSIFFTTVTSNGHITGVGTFKQPMNYLLHLCYRVDEAKVVPTTGGKVIDDDFFMMSIPVPTFFASV